MPEILISHNFEQAHREILKEILSGPAKINFLSDIAEEHRAGVIEQADVIISWNPAKEFSAEELKLLGRVRLIQLVTAGAEHLPFPLLPSSAIIASNPGAICRTDGRTYTGYGFRACKTALRKSRQIEAGGIRSENEEQEFARACVRSAWIRRDRAGGGQGYALCRAEDFRYKYERPDYGKGRFYRHA